jgi:hypothetical protein
MDDLWAILDNHQTFSTEHGQTLRARRLSERAVMSELRLWLLRDYAAAYCRSLAETRIFRRCYWIDGLGIDARKATTDTIKRSLRDGGGSLRGDGESLQEAGDQKSDEAVARSAEMQEECLDQENGKAPRAKKSRAKVTAQPVHAALQPVIDLSQALARDSKPITLRGFLLTAGSSKRKEARGQLNGHLKKQPVLPKDSGLVHASWLEAAATIFDELAQSPAIFLLNPLGATSFSYNDLSSLYQRTVPTELCLLIPHKQVEVMLSAAQRSSTQAGSLTELLRSDRWKTLPATEEQLSRAVDGWLGLFIASMQRYFQIPVQTIPLLARTGPASVERIPYTLLFATRRQDSLLSMNDAVYNYRHQLTLQSWQGVLGEDWFVQQQQQHWQAALQDLARRILEQGRAQRVRRWPDLRQQLLLANFGQFRKQDYDMLIQQLLLDREVRCEWRQRSVETIKVPGNEDTLLWR